MGGHGGLNILPQKKWNVYRHDRQYQVKFDEHRDIEKKLKDKDRIKRERLSDSLVELRRKAQDVENRDAEVEFEVKKRRKPSSKRDTTSSPERYERREDSPGYDEPVSEPVERKPSGHINFFEKEERAAEEMRNKRREHLIKSGHYIYNSDTRGPRKLNVFVEDEDAKANPDFKRQPTPWYMRPKLNESGHSSEERRTLEGNRTSKKESREKARVKTKEELRSERLARESSERERALALLKSK